MNSMYCPDTLELACGPVTAVRLALQGTTAYQRARPFWRGERRIRAAVRAGLRDHLPDGELHWPAGAALSWAGECWAIQAELTHQAVTRTSEVMRELLARTGDYGCPGAQAAEPGQPLRHARVLYLCSPAALPAVAQARDELGTLGARIEIRNLPGSAALSLMPPRSADRAGNRRSAGRRRPGLRRGAPRSRWCPVPGRTSRRSRGLAAG